MLVAMTGITVAILPAEVDSRAYVVGAGNQRTFNPVSYGQSCGVPRGGSRDRVAAIGYAQRHNIG